MVNVVNVVASGTLGRELDLRNLSDDLPSSITTYEPEVFAGLQVKFDDDGPVLIAYSTGSYVIMGGKSEDQINETYDRFLDLLSELGVRFDAGQKRPVVKNLICKGSIEQEVDLNALTILLGMEQTEYEPEQSPFVYYWPAKLDCLLTIPSNGEVIVTGVTQTTEAEEAIAYLREQLDEAKRRE